MQAHGQLVYNKRNTCTIKKQRKKKVAGRFILIFIFLLLIICWFIFFEAPDKTLLVRGITANMDGKTLMKHFIGSTNAQVVHSDDGKEK